ncbi:MAG: hypothetical protein FWC16_04105 [Defluviitaleaceae bacterium]|nr:hypothetical protein [Defluviitaleaceae bacterium]MCL2274010.1 hypothetical protein [Defluviitaleaceae bacterium]MCL2274089.1 hypothetical protein [Defluviitaleaceae bacterium]
MERVHYRRVRPPAQHINTYYEPEEEPVGALGETLILQGIISGVILVIVMLVSIITFAPLSPAQEAIAGALYGAQTPRELFDTARQFATSIGVPW